MNKTFDAASHTYKLGGQRVPSITGSLPSKGYEFVHPRLLEAACEDGRHTHEIIHGFVTGGHLPDDLDLKAAKKLEAFRQWYDTWPHPLVLSETPLFSERFKFGGTPDQVFQGPDSLIIVDAKRRPARPLFDALQLAGQNILLRENNYGDAKRERYILEVVQVKKDYRVRLVKCWHKHAEDLFLALIQKYHRDRALDLAVKNYFAK